MVYALDSTTIDLCLLMFTWASFRSTRAAVKIHTLLDLRGIIPRFLHVFSGKVHDVNILDMMILEPAAINVVESFDLDPPMCVGTVRELGNVVTVDTDVGHGGSWQVTVPLRRMGVNLNQWTRRGVHPSIAVYSTWLAVACNAGLFRQGDAIKVVAVGLVAVEQDPVKWLADILVVPWVSGCRWAQCTCI